MSSGYNDCDRAVNVFSSLPSTALIPSNMRLPLLRRFDVRTMEVFAFGVLVAALLAQSLALALHPKTSNSAVGHLNPHAHYGAREPGSEPVVAVTGAHTLRAFLVHGIVVTLAALAPHDNALPNTAKPMTRAAWEDSPYYRAGLHFSHWSKIQAAQEAHRYDGDRDHRFDAAWHPFDARLGYWLGRLMFLWLAVGIGGVWGMLLGLTRIESALAT